ncbi:MAG: outer membrane lipoprotein carrier protein LolA [Alphaproteobacteria bacterium]|nr:outer membrane lipoprotein carrier protein LolA [Alphaproteobacteria bacterium]
MKNIVIILLAGLFLRGGAVLAANNPVAADNAALQKNKPENIKLENIKKNKKASRKEIERNKKNAAILHKIEQHLNSIHSMRSEFIQQAPDGTTMQGMLYLERPGKLRFDYGKKAPFLLVSNGTMLTFIDYQVKQVSRWPIRKTPLGILVDKTIKFGSSVKIPDIVRFAGLVKVPVFDPKRRQYGHIVLIFEQSTLELRAWQSVDAQGYVTRVALVNPVYNVKINPKRFTYKDPRPPRHGPRRH